MGVLMSEQNIKDRTDSHNTNPLNMIANFNSPDTSSTLIEHQDSVRHCIKL